MESKVNIVNRDILSEVIWRFRIILTVIPIQFFTEIKKKINNFQFHMEKQKIQNR